MTVGVIGLDYPLTESMLEGNNQTIIIRDSDCTEFCHSAKPWISTRRGGRTCTQFRRERSESPGICRRIWKGDVNPMMTEVTDAEGGSRSEGLLQFEIPFLILR